VRASAGVLQQRVGGHHGLLHYGCNRAELNVYIGIKIEYCDVKAVDIDPGDLVVAVIYGLSGRIVVATL